MLNISYAISPKLNGYLSEIENLRKKILLTPVSPATELELRWEAILNRIFNSLKLSGNTLTRQEVLNVLAGISHKKISADQQDVVKYKKAQDYISQSWLGLQNPVNAQDLIDLHKIIGSGRLRIPRAGLQHLLDYLQARSENPITRAAIVNIEIAKMQLFSDHNFQISCLAAQLFLYKYGYDFKGFLAYEAEWAEDNGYKANYERALGAVSLTLWLEYFASCILRQAEHIEQSITKPKLAISEFKESFWRLNTRQKTILSFLDQPQAAITNREVQKRCKTSQITASRDLAKLTHLGFLFSHGKGRSVNYTKI